MTAFSVLGGRPVRMSGRRWLELFLRHKVLLELQFNNLEDAPHCPEIVVGCGLRGGIFHLWNSGV
jgi:hypothetical protein